MHNYQYGRNKKFKRQNFSLGTFYITHVIYGYTSKESVVTLPAIITDNAI